MLVERVSSIVVDIPLPWGGGYQFQDNVWKGVQQWQNILTQHTHTITRRNSILQVTMIMAGTVAHTWTTPATR